MTKKYLNELKIGEIGKIVSLEEEEGIKRRLFDIGFIPGTEIECVLKSPFKDPIAYFIRGTLIALRGVNAKNILVEVGCNEG